MWGGVIIVCFHALRKDFSHAYQSVKPGGDRVAVRLKFNECSNSIITFDVAIEKDSFKWQLNLGVFSENFIQANCQPLQLD